MNIAKLLVGLFLTIACLFTIIQHDVNAEVVVYDADGQMLGLLIDYDLTYIYGLKVFNPSLSKFIMLNELGGNIQNIALYFSSFDCTGTPYIEARNANFINIQEERYYTGSVTEMVRFIAHSVSWGNTCQSGNYNNSYVPAEDVTNIVHLTSPVDVPLSFDTEPTHPGKWEKRKRWSHNNSME